MPNHSQTTFGATATQKTKPKSRLDNVWAPEKTEYSLTSTKRKSDVLEEGSSYDNISSPAKRPSITSTYAPREHPRELLDSRRANYDPTPSTISSRLGMMGVADRAINRANGRRYSNIPTHRRAGSCVSIAPSVASSYHYNGSDVGSCTSVDWSGNNAPNVYSGSDKPYIHSGRKKHHFKPGDIIRVALHTTNVNANIDMEKDGDRVTRTCLGPVYSKARPMVVLWLHQNHMFVAPMFTNGGTSLGHRSDIHEYVCVKEQGNQEFVNEGVYPELVAVSKTKPMHPKSRVHLAGGCNVRYQEKIEVIGALTDESVTALIKRWQNFAEEAITEGMMTLMMAQGRDSRRASAISVATTKRVGIQPGAVDSAIRIVAGV